MVTEALQLTRQGSVKAVKTIQSLSSRLAALRDRTESIAAKTQHVAVAAGTGYAYGSIKKRASSRREALPTVLGLNPSLVYTVAAFAVGEMVGGRTGEIIHSGTTALAAIAGYEMGLDSGTGRRAADEGTAATTPAVHGARY